MYITRTQFEARLQQLRNRMLAMGSAADRMVEQAVQALSAKDLALAERVIADDDQIDAMDLEIEQECLSLIALQAPVAHDLHVIGSALKAITDLERIGDHAVDIAKVARKLANDVPYAPLVDVPLMAGRVRQMLRDALTALVNHDLKLVDVVVESDDEVDTLYHRLRDELHAAMRQDPAVVVQASYLLLVAHYLERIADHTVNIAERVYFAETGELAQLAKSHKATS